MRMNCTADRRLHGGVVHAAEDGVGVVYNADGHMSEALATPLNTTIAVITRNRSAYLRDLLQSIDADLSRTVPRYVLVNNTQDDTVEMLKTTFPHWRVDHVCAENFNEPSAGFVWLKRHRPVLLTESGQAAITDYGPTRSIAWLRNRMLRQAQTRFLLSFDDDMLVKPGWFEYLLTLQNRCYAYAVINNFASFLLDKGVISRIGWFDERFLRSHGYEDNDFLARLNEARLRWVLGFNHDHDWRSAEEGNPRGSGTGCDLFVHRYAKAAGGFSASMEEHEAARHNPDHFGNWRWYRSKWREIAHDPEHATVGALQGVMDRPPFKGYLLQRLEADEPDWYPTVASPPSTPPLVQPTNAASGRKLSQNTPIEEIDILARPATATMVDRYVLFSHWCKGKMVLDAGCGHGYGSALLYDLGAAEVVGLDADDSTLRVAQARHGRAGLSFDVANLFEFPDRYRRQFDVVVCVEVFEHVPQEHAQRLLLTLRQALREGGTLIVTTPRRKTAVWNYDGGTHLYEYSAHEFEEIVRTAMSDARLLFGGIREFQVEGGAQWYSQWQSQLDDTATVMVAVAEKVPLQPVVIRFDPMEHEVRRKLVDSTSVPRMSILLSNRNTLPFLRLAVKSCREHLSRADHEILVYDDASTDGSAQWLQANAGRYNLKVLFHQGPQRRGIVYVYDDLVAHASEPITWLVHSDMFFAKGADAELWRHFGPDTVATCTRVEPPLHQAEPHRFQEDFGVDAASFREEEFLRWAETKKDRSRTTAGIFAPVMMWKSDYLALGGHDKLFAPQSREDSDLFCRTQLAGLRFVQSWSSICYHFSGRGSRRKDSATMDSHEWQESNAKNERNFIRKWGTPVKHDHWLKPIVVPKRPVTLVGLLGNERHCVAGWLTLLEPYFDEIILIDDSTDGSIDVAKRFMEDEAKVSFLAKPDKLRILAQKLGGDFSAARNRAHETATFDWLLHIDLDEQPTGDILGTLQDTLGRLEAERQLVCGFRRLNILDGAVVNDIPRSQWMPHRLRQAADDARARGVTVQNADLQFRLVRRDVRWINAVHEVPQPAAAFFEKGTHPQVTVFPRGWIRHEKSLRRQAEQDSFYQRLVGKAGPHGQWSPESILEQMDKGEELEST